MSGVSSSRPISSTGGTAGTLLPYNTLNEILQGFETPASNVVASSTVANTIAQPALTAAMTNAPALSGITQQANQLMQQQQQQPLATSFMDLLTGGGAHIAANALGGVVGPHLATSSNTALSALNNNQEFLVNLNSYNNDGFGENIGNGTTNLYIIRTPLARWNEECTVLDSHSMHHVILLFKPRIIAALEAYRNEELNEKRERRLKEEKDKLNKREEAEQQAQAQAQAAAASAAAEVTSTANMVEMSVDTGTPAAASSSTTTTTSQQMDSEETTVTNTIASTALTETVAVDIPLSQETVTTTSIAGTQITLANEVIVTEPAQVVADAEPSAATSLPVVIDTKGNFSLKNY